MTVFRNAQIFWMTNSHKTSISKKTIFDKKIHLSLVTRQKKSRVDKMLLCQIVLKSIHWHSNHLRKTWQCIINWSGLEISTLNFWINSPSRPKLYPFHVRNIIFLLWWLFFPWIFEKRKKSTLSDIITFFFRKFDKIMKKCIQV